MEDLGAVVNRLDSKLLDFKIDLTSNIKDVRLSRRYGKVDYEFLSLISDLDEARNEFEGEVVTFLNKSIKEEEVEIEYVNNLSEALCSMFAKVGVFNRDYEPCKPNTSIKRDGYSLHCRSSVLVKGYSKDDRENDVTEALINFKFSLPLEEVEKVKEELKGA